MTTPNEETLRRIFLAKPDDISCDQSAEIMAQLADSKAIYNEVAQLDNSFTRHLRSCADCMMETQVLLEFAQVADTEKSSSTIPNRPGRKTLVDEIQKSFRKIFTFDGFKSGQLSAVRGSSFSLEPTIIEISDELSIELDPSPSPQNSELRDLFISLDGGGANSLEGESVVAVDQSMVVKGQAVEVTLDQFGEAKIEGLYAQQPYDLIIDFAKERFKIESIVIP